MTVLTRIEAGVATLTLNRPREMNAFDEETVHGIVDALELLAADASVRVLVIAGEGPAFSAGGDFHWVLEWPALDSIQRGDNADAMNGAVQAIYEFPKPSIARVQGTAVGGGIGVMLACDYAVAASSARFGLTSVRNGLLAGIAIPELIQAVGPRVARQLLLHGGMFDAAEALRIGLVDRVVARRDIPKTLGSMLGTLMMGRAKGKAA